MGASEVRSAAAGLLARRDYAVGELKSKLVRKGHPASEVDAVIEELKAGRALDDRRYAGRYVAYHAARGQGPVRLKADLRALGISAEDLEDALSEGPDFAALAAEVRRKKFGGEPPGDYREKTRQARFLQYRGFSPDHIRSALDFDV